jgi:hypothetical protein
MKFTIFGDNHQVLGTVQCDTLKDLGRYLSAEYDADEICCVEDETGWGYNAQELIEETVE